MPPSRVTGAPSISFNQQSVNAVAANVCCDFCCDFICLNLRSIKSNFPYLKFLCTKYRAVICLSEYWLHTYESDFLSVLSPDYNYIVECTRDCEDPNFCFPCILRGHGDTALLWHRVFSKLVSPVSIPRNDHIVGIRISRSPSDIIVFFSVSSCKIWHH